MPEAMVNFEVIESAGQLACRAPSLHNSQPWRWVAEHAAVHLFLDSSSILHSTDRSGRQALISCWRRARSLPRRDGRRRLGGQR